MAFNIHSTQPVPPHWPHLLPILPAPNNPGMVTSLGLLEPTKQTVSVPSKQTRTWGRELILEAMPGGRNEREVKSQ